MKRRSKSTVAVYAAAAICVLGTACNSTELETEEAYSLVALSTRNITVQVEAAGTVEPVTTVEVRSKASGEIFEMMVEIGDEVRGGEMLLKVDPRVPEASLRQAIADSALAQAQLETAESQLRRVEALHETQSVTEVDFENARLELARARAQLISAEQSVENARISAENTDVRAPITGVVIDKRVEEGSVITSATGASAGSVLLTMANLDTVQVRSLVDETDIGRVEPGLQVTITVDAYPNRPFRGRVYKIEPQAEVTSNVTMFPVLVRIPNEDGLLRPGMNGEVDISIGRRRDVVAVPNNALRTFRDFTSAAVVLGLDPLTARQQLMETRPEGLIRGLRGDSGVAPVARTASAGDSTRQGMGLGLRDMVLPDGVTREQVRAIMMQRREEGEESLTAEQRALLDRLGIGQRPPPGTTPNAGMSGPEVSSSNDPLAAIFIVFVMRDSVPTPTWVRTGLTDETYSEVLEGVTATDTVLVLASLASTSDDDSPPMGPGRGMGRGMGRPPR
jgi:HlyD family secretion protein